MLTTIVPIIAAIIALSGVIINVFATLLPAYNPRLFRERRIAFAKARLDVLSGCYSLYKELDALDDTLRMEITRTLDEIATVASSDTATQGVLTSRSQSWTRFSIRSGTWLCTTLGALFAVSWLQLTLDHDMAKDPESSIPFVLIDAHNAISFGALALVFYVASRVLEYFIRRNEILPMSTDMDEAE